MMKDKMEKLNFNVVELGIGIPFAENSSTEKVNFNRKYLFTHNDERWDTKPDRQSFYKEVVEMDLHSMSHVDSINHRAQNRYGFRGVRYDKEPSAYQYGAEATPIIKGRALMIDFPKYLGIECLSEDNGISEELIKECLNFQSVKIEDYQIVLIRTGYIKYWKRKEYTQYFEKAAGLNPDAIEWLAEKDIVAVGADNYCVENMPTKENSYSAFYPGHKKFLGEKGIYIMENLNLDPLSERNVNTFYFIAAPIRINKASAAFINPVAIF